MWKEICGLRGKLRNSDDISPTKLETIRKLTGMRLIILIYLQVISRYQVGSSLEFFIHLIPLPPFTTSASLYIGYIFLNSALHHCI